MLFKTVETIDSFGIRLKISNDLILTASSLPTIPSRSDKSIHRKYIATVLVHGFGGSEIDMTRIKSNLAVYLDFQNIIILKEIKSIPN